jgi:NAD kinase
VWTNGDSSSSSASPSNNKNQTEDPNPLVFTPADDEQAPTTTRSKRRMSLMWCDRDKCKDVVRERIVGKHNQLILNGPATGQVAYRWRDEDATLRSASPSSSNSHTKDTAATTSISASILLLVKPDDRLFQQAAQILPQLTQAGIQVLLVPELAAELKDTYGLDDDDDDKDTNSVENANIVPFDPPAETNAFRQDRRVDDDEEDWVQDLWPMEPFPDLICTLGGDGLLIHASMLFQGPIPPILSIAGGSLGFLTCFEIEEMVDSIKIALGVSSNEESSDSPEADELEVFPPNMPSYPYEPLMIQRPRQHWEGPQAKATFGMDGVICMTVRMRLDCRVVNPEGIVRNRYNVLNEVVIDRGSSSYLANLECFCDDVHLTTVQADGIIFAT